MMSGGMGYSAAERGGQDSVFPRTDPVLKRPMLPSSLSELEPHLIDRVMKTRKVFEPGTILVDEHMLDSARPKFLVSGWASRQYVMHNGRRVIFSFLIPGNIVGPDFIEPKCGTASTVALTEVTTVDIPVSDQPERTGPPSVFCKAMQRDKSEAGTLLYSQIIRVGGMTGMESIAHLLLELHRRLFAMGLADERWFPLPLSQDVLADALGFSAVHVNRTLQQLRRLKLIDYCEGTVKLSNLDGLEALANGTFPQHPRGNAPFTDSAVA
jgi:CRP-like cAMP-binding protein